MLKMIRQGSAPLGKPVRSDADFAARHRGSWRANHRSGKDECLARVRTPLLQRNRGSSSDNCLLGYDEQNSASSLRWEESFFFGAIDRIEPVKRLLEFRPSAVCTDVVHASLVTAKGWLTEFNGSI